MRPASQTIATVRTHATTLTPKKWSVSLALAPSVSSEKVQGRLETSTQELSLKNYVKTFVHREALGQMFRLGLIGGFNTVFTLSLSVLFREVFSMRDEWAVTAAWVIGTLVSYALNMLFCGNHNHECRSGAEGPVGPTRFPIRKERNLDEVGDTHGGRIE